MFFLRKVILLGTLALLSACDNPAVFEATSVAWYIETDGMRAEQVQLDPAAFHFRFSNRRSADPARCIAADWIDLYRQDAQSALKSSVPLPPVVYVVGNLEKNGKVKGVRFPVSLASGLGLSVMGADESGITIMGGFVRDPEAAAREAVYETSEPPNSSACVGCLIRDHTVHYLRQEQSIASSGNRTPRCLAPGPLVWKKSPGVL